MSWGLACRSFALLVLTFAVSDFAAAQSNISGGTLRLVSSRPISGTPAQPDAGIVINPLAAYSNVTNFGAAGFANGGAALIGSNSITRLVADDLNLVGTAPFSAVGFTFSVANLDAVTVTARPRVRFFRPDGAGGGPGTLIQAASFEPIAFPASVTQTFEANFAFVIPVNAIWAGITFDNFNGTTGATIAQLDQLGQGVFNPVDVGTSADQFFRTTAAGDFFAGNPAGATGNLGGKPLANFGWEIRTQAVDLSITKDDGLLFASPGGSVTYTITATNNGAGNIVNATVADPFPGILTCNWSCIGSGPGNTCAASGSGDINDATVALVSGGSVTYTASCAVSAAATGVLANTATIAPPATAVDANPANNTATDIDTVRDYADVAITKTDGVTTATPGGSVTYTITASNAGPAAASGATVVDTFPTSLTCAWTCIGAGSTCTAAGSGNINDTVNLPAAASVTYTAICTISAAATGTLADTATILQGPEADPDGTNNSATDTDELEASADLSVTKTDGVTTATPGGSVTYTITASNAGPSSARPEGANGPDGFTASIVTDTFPASLTCTWTCVGAGGGICAASGAGNISTPVTLPAGGSVIFTASCAISAAATGTLSNTATIATGSGATDPNPANNSATDVDTLGTSADLSITKTDGVSSVTAGANTTYTIVASNAGPSAATGATVTDTFPASLSCTWACTGNSGGTCTSAGAGNVNDTVNLPSGGSVTYVATCAVSAAATGTLSNTATVTAPKGATDPNLENNSATDSDTVSPAAAASVTGTKTASGTFAPGSTVAYTVVLNNDGAGAQGDNPGNEFTDVLPASLVLVSATSSSGTAAATTGTNTVTWNGAIPAGGSVTITITATVAPTAAGGSTVSNQGSIATDLDGNGSNETTRTTDNPGTQTASDPTTFVVAGTGTGTGGGGIVSVPTLGTWTLALLALLLVGFATVRTRTRT